MISACRKHVVAATGPSPFKVGDNQRPERTMSGVRKPPPESSVPGENLPRGSRRNQLRRGHGSPPVLGEVPHELSTASHSKECKRSPQQFIPAGFPLTTTFSRGRKTQPKPHHTGPGPFLTRPPVCDSRIDKKISTKPASAGSRYRSPRRIALNMLPNTPSRLRSTAAFVLSTFS